METLLESLPARVPVAGSVVFSTPQLNNIPAIKKGSIDFRLKFNFFLKIPPLIIIFSPSPYLPFPSEDPGVRAPGGSVCRTKMKMINQ
jgi:hypothetical protein